MAKSPAIPVQTANPTAALGINTTDWEDQKLGFDPYYTPKPGDVFVATPMAIDDRDPEFVRCQWMTEHSLDCARGPKDDAEPVAIESGETFNMGAYAALAAVFTDYIGIQCRVTVGEKTKISGNRTLWNFKLAVSQKDSLRLKEARKTNAAARRLQAQEKAKEIAAKGADASA
jgi:hypothetical protein